MKKKHEETNGKIIELEKKVAELTNSWKRALADYQNLSRRVQEEKEQFAKYAKADLLQKILPSLDNLLKSNAEIKNQGLAISLEALFAVLQNEGLSEIEVLGMEFDPTIMEAVEMVDGAKNRVVEVCQKGYRLYNRVLRPAKVKVGRGTSH